MSDIWEGLETETTPSVMAKQPDIWEGLRTETALSGEEQRAKRLLAASPDELRNIHFGENIPAEAQAQPKNVISQFLQGALVQAPAQAIASIPQLPALAYKAATQPNQVAASLLAAPGEEYRKLSEGTPEETGQAVANIASMALPMAPKMAQLTKATGAAGIELAAGRAGAAARKLIGSELKLAKSEQLFSKDPVKAVIEEKLTGNSLSDWKENVTTRKQELLNSIEDTLAKSNKTIPVNDIVSKLDPEIARIKASVGITNKETVLKNIEILQAEILDKYPDKLTLPEALKLRREIDDSISRWTPDAVEQSTNRAKYELRTGINREIESQSPGIAAKNRRASELIDVEHALDRRIRQTEGHNITGLGDIGMGAAGEIAGHLAGAPFGVSGAAAIAARKVLGSTAVKTRVANFLGNLGTKERALFQALPEELQASVAGIKMSQESQPEISARLAKQRERESNFEFDTLYKRLMSGEPVENVPLSDAQKVLDRLDAAPGDNPAVRKQMNEIVSKEGAGTKMSQGESPDTFETVIGYRPKSSTIVLNDAAMDRLTKLTNSTYLKGAEATPTQVAKLKKAMPEVFKMVDSDKPLTIQRIATAEEHKELARHEGTHRASTEVLGGKGMIQIDPDQLAYSKDLYDRAAERKAKLYLPDKWTEEIFADLATGNSSRLGMTRREGLQLLGDMLEQIQSKYGPEGTTTLMRRMAPKFSAKELPEGLKVGELSDFFPYTPKGNPWKEVTRQRRQRVQ